MITRVVIRNWQSLRHLDVSLGRFTVIVGASSSGKTAFMRAMRAAASNVRGAGSITRGAKATAVTVHTGQHIVTLERGEAAGCYRLTGPDGEHTYTKLAGAVPEAVTRALRLDPVPTGGASLNFAGQFDRPYLLDESGATVARVLGELTNVSSIFAAVREANRRRAAAAAALKTREADLADLVTESRTYAGLPARLAACQKAEEHAQAAAGLQARTHRLRAALENLTVAEGVLARTAVPAIPDDRAATDAATALRRFHALLEQASTARTRIHAANQELLTSQQHEAQLSAELHAALAAAGTCPTCGQPVT
jgi:energy-coupling factor transporter ATP-binding protein EcfA2